MFRNYKQLLHGTETLSYIVQWHSPVLWHVTAPYSKISVMWNKGCLYNNAASSDYTAINVRIRK